MQPINEIAAETNNYAELIMKSVIFGIIAVVLQSCDSIIYRDTIATASATNTRLFVKKVKKRKTQDHFSCNNVSRYTYIYFPQ